MVILAVSRSLSLYGENTKMSYSRTKMDYSRPNLGYISCALHARSNMKITAPSPFLRSSPHPKISGMIFFFSAIRVTFSSSFFLLRAKKILGSPTQKICEPACQVQKFIPRKASPLPKFYSPASARRIFIFHSRALLLTISVSLEA